ncbi:ABC transporter substrate-binding protein [Aeromicrobium tamlense]|uniref:ABC transporter substrate-binding protein n=1 Tax=Aeromicrobium tamlense TaxID=375541 RepID=A0A8I0FY19_9ACTN|nr:MULTISPECIES: ABC transporter substrate-binding protein [Aeromicrobium]MBD1269464.1 ABC transporter substrate-binding protein [Aeromicrobium tamlense]NYI36627.1 branched-chain amino acid transport system substrate-binding protein [Aeromicrobium tamlense]
MSRKQLMLAALAGGALMLSACGGGDEAGDKDTIVVAVAGPMTGENAIYGKNQLAGVQFAAKQINDGGGVESGPLKGAKIEVKSFDDVADPNQGASVAQKICDDDDIMAVFGHSNSSVTLAAMPIYERCGIPLFVSYSSNPEITAELHENLFRTLIDDASMGAEMAYQAGREIGAEKVGLIASDDDYGTGLVESFEETAPDAGLEVVDSIATTTGQKDFTPQLTTLRNQGVDTIVLLNTYTDAALQIKQADALGWDDVKILVTAGSNTPELVKIAGKDAVEGVLVNAVFDPNSSSEGVKSFVDAYSADNGEAPGEANAVAYDSFFVFLDGLENGGEDRESLISQVADTESFELPIRGTFRFDENQGAAVDPDSPATALLEIQDGAFASFTP